jgi:oxygen-independent coproporphyrinogen-3 oxidase
MVYALASELELQKHYLSGAPIRTLYLGGGTPSLLDAQELELLLNALHEHYDLTGLKEFTLEANPDDLTADKLALLRSFGVDRLSIGIQSFQDSTLKYLHRLHDARQALEAYALARKAGFENISIDLMFGIPDSANQAWLDDIEQALQLRPEHISAYCLTIESRTVFGHWWQKNKLTPVSEDKAASQFELLMERLSGAGYEQYEISNFARGQRFAMHNSSYWQHIPYLGIGPGAHSFDGKSRQFNIRQNHHYIKRIQATEVPAGREELSTLDLANEYMMMSIRTSQGLDLGKLEKRYGVDSALILPVVAGHLAEGTMIQSGNLLWLTPRGRLLADEITAQLFLDRL